jgi:hypothetical protein
MRPENNDKTWRDPCSPAQSLRIAGFALLFSARPKELAAARAPMAVYPHGRLGALYACPSQREDIMYLIVTDESGRTVARRAVTRERLATWLLLYGPTARRCEVYTDAPERGGERVATLRRNAGQDWLAA